MKTIFKLIIIILAIVFILLSIYIALNYKEDYIECTYNTKEISYGRIIKEYPPQTRIIHINHLLKKIYSPQDITIEGKLISDSSAMYEIENTFNTPKMYPQEYDCTTKTKISIDRISGGYNSLSRLQYYKGNILHHTIEEYSTGYCKYTSQKF